MGKLIKAEIAKVWRSKLFVCVVLLLLLANSFFLVRESQKESEVIPSAAYRAMSQALAGKTQQECGAFIQEEFETAEAMWKLDNYAQRELFGTDEIFLSQWREENAALIERYNDMYLAGDYLKYTDNLKSEYLFLSQIWNEYQMVDQYDDFLAGIQKNAEAMGSISIFASEGDDYDRKNIELTAKQYADVGQVDILYSPQKGLYTALHYWATDVLFALCIFAVAFFLVREEKDNGLLALVRTNYKGRLPTALAKLAALGGSELILLVAFYGTNLLICHSLFGLGSLQRSIQSLPFLVYSIYNINVLQYIAIFFLCKWISVLIIGFWILLSTMLAKSFLSSVFLSVSLIGANLLVYMLIPATSRLQILKYFNFFGLLNTNDILANHRNLYWFGTPVPMPFIEAVAAAFFILALSVVFCTIFTFSHFPEKMKKRSASGAVALVWSLSNRYKKNSVNKYEFIKHYVFGGVLVVLLFFLGYQLYTAVTATPYLDADELIYKQYMQQIDGPFTTQTRDWFVEEGREFDQYTQDGNMPFGKAKEKVVFDQIVSRHLAYIAANPKAHFVYDTGYAILFGVVGRGDFTEALYSSFLSVFCFSMVFSSENGAGMARLLATTPNGKRQTVDAKLGLCSLTACAICALATFPRFWEVICGYGLPGLGAPAMSLMFLPHYPSWLPIFCIPIVSFIMRFVAVNACARLICLLTLRIKSLLGSLLAAFSIFGLPLLLSSAGLPLVHWLSIYPMFHAVAITSASLTDTLGVLFIFAFWLLAGYLAKHALRTLWGKFA